jgi:hypothetical protein
MTNLPVLDGSYATATAELNRVIIDTFGHIEPHIDELDTRCALPLRLVHNQAASWHLEIGPYAIDGRDIEKLRAAIHAYDHATNPKNPAGEA